MTNGMNRRKFNFKLEEQRGTRDGYLLIAYGELRPRASPDKKRRHWNDPHQVQSIVLTSTYVTET